jgi:type I restriction enzyme S subunit
MSIGHGTLDLSNSRVVSSETWAQWMPKPTKRHDVILTSEAPLGRVALVLSNEQMVLAQRVFGLRGRAGVLDSRFLFYAFQTQTVQADLQGRATGTTVTGIRQPALLKVRIPAPPFEEQRAIAEVLGALDDKIAANRRLAESADSLSQAVFRSLAGEALSVPLSATARFVNGKAFTKGASGTGRVVIRIAELNSGLGGSTVFSDAEVGDDFLARPGDILFAWSGSLTLHRWFRAEAMVNQHIFKVIPNEYPSWLVYELLRDRMAYFKGIAADKATTMGHIQRRHLDELVDVPSSSSIDRVDGLMTSLWDRTFLAERENETLAATRDALLPQLMSGALRVRDAESSLEGVV